MLIEPALEPVGNHQDFLLVIVDDTASIVIKHRTLHQYITTHKMSSVWYV